MANIAVFCASSAPRAPYDKGLLYLASLVGQDLATDGHTVVYGGSDRGLMGEVARNALIYGGKVVGYVPAAMQRKEPPLAGVELHVCESLPARMEAFRRVADAYLVLPGGTGTMEEFAAMLNAMAFSLWQLPVEEAMKPKPIGLVAHKLTLPLWEFVVSGMEAGLVDKNLKQHMAFQPWNDLQVWLNGFFPPACHPDREHGTRAVL